MKRTESDNNELLWDSSNNVFMQYSPISERWLPKMPSKWDMGDASFSPANYRSYQDVVLNNQPAPKPAAETGGYTPSPAKRFGGLGPEQFPSIQLSNGQMSTMGIPMPWRNKTKTEGTTLASNPQVRQTQIPYGQNVKTVTEPQTENNRQIQVQNKNNALTQQNSDRGATLQPIQAEMPRFKDAERKADGYITRSINRHNLPQSVNRVIDYAGSNLSESDWRDMNNELNPWKDSKIMGKVMEQIPDGSIKVNIDPNQGYPGTYIVNKGITYSSPTISSHEQMEELTHAAQHSFYGDKFDDINLANTELEAKFIDDYIKYVTTRKEGYDILTTYDFIPPGTQEYESFLEKIYNQGGMLPEDIKEYHRWGGFMPQNKTSDGSSYDKNIPSKFAEEFFRIKPK